MALTKHPIADLIARRGGLVIDGAMSTPLEAAGLNLNDTLWSAKALLECPDLVVAANAVVQPMGLYSNKIHSLDDIKADTKIAIPNDPSNGGRALVLLEKAGIIKLKPDYKGEASIHDVAENPRGVKLVELEAAQLPISLQDLDVACVPMNYAVSGGLDVNKQGFYFESRDAKYALIIIAARPDNVQSPEVQTFVKCYQSPEVAAFIKEKFKGQINPAWEQPAK